MILTVTPAPALDLTLEIEQLVVGKINRSNTSIQEASGKGVNVSWALHRGGIRTLALFPAGGTGAAVMAQALSGAQLPHRIVPITAELRTNVTLRPETGDETKINSPGSPLTEAEMAQFFTAISEELVEATEVVISGSVPLGAPATLHAEIVRLARKAGVRTLVDTSGPALLESLDSRPDVITPNIHELAEMSREPLKTMSDTVVACQKILDRGVGMVVVSMGATGALLVTGETVLWGRAEGVRFVNSVGAGDALLAGLVCGGSDLVHSLSTAIWWASSAVESPGTLFSLNPALRSRVSVTTEIPLSAVVN